MSCNCPCPDDTLPIRVYTVGAPGTEGSPGPPNNLTVGDVYSVPDGSEPEVTIDGEPPDQTISFGLPQGEPGPQGPPGGSDESTAGWIESGPLTRAALDDWIGYRFIYVDPAYGDGSTDATAEIQAKINEASGTAMVVIPPGTYVVDTRVYLVQGTTIWAYGATIVRGTSNNTASILTNYPMGDTTTTRYNGNSDITVYGLTVDSDGVASGRVEANAATFNHARNLRFRDCVFLRTRGTHALELNSIDGAVVDNCRFLGFVPVPALGLNREAIQIDCAASGSVGSGATDGTPAKNIFITGCYFGPDGSTAAHTVAVGSHTLPPSDRYDGISVTNCVMDRITNIGIRPYGWRNSTVSGNNISIVAGSLNGIRADYSEALTIANNSVVAPLNSTPSISTLGVYNSCTRVGILGNQLYGGVSGITVQKSSECLVGNNEVTRSQGYGIILDASSDNLVQGNLINGPGYPNGSTSAMRASDASGGSNRNSFTGNKVVRHGAGTETSAGATFPAGSTDNWCFGNDFYGLAAATVGSVNTTSNRV